MEHIVMKISEIKNNPSNPRIIRDHKFAMLVESIMSFPEMLEIRPVVVNKDHVILGGNMRFKACIEAGLKKIPVIVASNLTPEQEEEFVVKDNVSGGEWDWDALANEWDNENLAEWGLDLPHIFGEVEEEEEPKKSKHPVKYLSWGKNKIPITKEESAQMDKALDDYAFEEGDMYGFIKLLTQRYFGTEEE